MRRFTLAFCLLVLTHFLHGQIKIGIITDLEENTQSRLIVEAFLKEIDNTLGVNKQVASSANLQFFEVASDSQAQSIYHKMSADLVLVFGGISTKAISDLSRLSIPVIGIGVVDPAIQKIPYQNGKSGKRNFTYLLTSRDFSKEIESFQKLVRFGRLSVLVDPAIMKIFNTTENSEIDSMENALGIEIELIEAGKNVEEVKKAIGRAEAVYLSGLFSRDREYIAAIADYLTEQKIPSFSTSRQHVELGILGSSSGDNGIEQVLRRVAIMADDILSGGKASEINVAFNTSESFYLNIETARKIEFSAPFEVLLTANIVGESNSEGRVYSFAEIANIALEKNLNVQISYQDIDLAALDVKVNKANILPSLMSGVSASRINEERANAGANAPEKTLNLDFSISQVIYSEEALAAIKISQYLKNAQAYQTEVDILNALLDTYSAYLDVLSAKTNLAIQRENLQNTRTNLELAKVRVNLGSSTNADLFRWESELANATQALVEAQAGLISLKFQLNTLLANSLEEDFDIKDIGMEDELFSSFKKGPLSKLIYTPKDLRVASDFLVQESITNNPNKKQLLENIKASERQFDLNKRLLYVPTIALQAQTAQVLARGGAGSEESNDPGIPTFGAGLQDNTWSAGISLSYPIFSGFSRRVNKQKSLVQLEQLKLSGISLDQNLELSIRASTVSLLSATTNLGYSKESSESATKNFQLVQSNYKAGKVNITQLIDAQQAALGAQLGAALSVYEYIAAHLQVEYGLGFFSMFLNENELTDFQNRFLEYVSNQ
ncbi:MAG: TolC family protein [Bacteroidota bacterium]